MAETDLRELTRRLDSIARGAQLSQVLFTANQFDVFALLEQPRTAAEVAEARGLNARATRMLLDALVGMELIVKEDGRYRNSELASTCLVPGAKAYQGHILNHLHHISRTWARMDESLKSGTCVWSERGGRTPEELRAFILGMSNISRMSAKEMLPSLDLSGKRHMLDLGGGPATYAITFLAAYPQMRATVFDFAEVLEIAKEEVAAAGMADRFSYLAGNMVQDPIGSGYDFILVSNIIHSLNSEENKDVVKKCYDALEPGGLLIIKDFLVDNDRSGPAFGLMFALNMLVNTPAGDTYTFEEVEQWTNEAGFKGGKIIDLTPQTRLWLVEK